MLQSGWRALEKGAEGRAEGNCAALQWVQRDVGWVEPVGGYEEVACLLQHAPVGIVAWSGR